MEKVTARNNFLLLHFIVFIWGWSPIFGKLISVDALQLVWFRVLFTIVFVSAYMIYIRQDLRIGDKDLYKLLVIGAIIAFHWYCFYHAIKVSNVSVALVAFSTGTLFSSFIEPLFYKRRLLGYEILFGLIIIGAIILIFKVETRYTEGIIYGVLAAFTSSLFTVWNGLLVRKLRSPVITFYELGGGFLALSIYLFFTDSFDREFFALPGADLAWLLLFASVGTAFPFIASVNLLRNINPYTVTLTVNLETVYGIIWAYFIFSEDKQLTIYFYIGALIILATIFANALLKNYLRR
ncbi:MAG: DMT family transporter [Bacteroidota bacterium]